MQLPRTGEIGEIPRRSQRFYKRDGYWYYNTREGAPIGPFDNLSDAIFGSNDYIEYLQHAPSFEDVIAAYN